MLANCTHFVCEDRWAVPPGQTFLMRFRKYIPLLCGGGCQFGISRCFGKNFDTVSYPRCILLTFWRSLVKGAQKM